MCAIKFSIELNTFQIDDKDLDTNNICEKSEQIFKMEDALVCIIPFSLVFWMTHQSVSSTH